MKNLPTALTLARMIAGPIVAGLILWGDIRALSEGLTAAKWPFIAALVLFVLAALTDAVDGILARRFDATSVLGAALDHAADKVLTACTFVALAVTALATDLIVAVILILARDAAIGGLREGLALAGRAMPVSQGGKLKTVLVLTGAGAALMMQTMIYANAPADFIGWMDIAARGLIWAGAAVALYTGVEYARLALTPKS